MQFQPLFFVFAAGCLTLGISQAVLPIAHAQEKDAAPQYKVRVKNVQVTRAQNGIEVTGQIVNTGTALLTYTSIITVFKDRAGVEVAHGAGYLTAGPVQPGQSASFRATSPSGARFKAVSLRLTEAGQTVTVETDAAPPAAPLQASAKRRTTAW